MRCRDCKWWINAGTYGHWHDGTKAYAGDCDSPKMHVDGLAEITHTQDDETRCIDDDGFSDYLVTRPNFGCIHFTPKDGEA